MALVYDGLLKSYDFRRACWCWITSRIVARGSIVSSRFSWKFEKRPKSDTFDADGQVELGLKMSKAKKWGKSNLELGDHVPKFGKWWNCWKIRLLLKGMVLVKELQRRWTRLEPWSQGIWKTTEQRTNGQKMALVEVGFWRKTFMETSSLLVWSLYIPFMLVVREFDLLLLSKPCGSQ